MNQTDQIRWPGWRTVRLIGRGSFGAVYEIERDLFGKTEKAALKHIGIPQSPAEIDELYNDGYDDESITSTFRSHLENIVAEYSLMRKLNGSANVVNCDDVQYIQREDGFGWDIYIKMELLTPLPKALADPIAVETTQKVAKDLCQALILCRRFNIVHRDIKPQNIFVSPLGDYKLGDFGIAKTMERTMGGTKTGTYKYMAPEVYNNQPYGHSADLYSLGLVLYWMLNKRRMPFVPLPPARLGAGVDEQARNRRLSGEMLPPPADGSDELKRIVLKACAYDPKDRYHTAEDMLADLEAMERGTLSAALPDDRFARQSGDGLEDATVGAFGIRATSRQAEPASGGEGTVGAFRRPEMPATQRAVPPEADGTVGAFHTAPQKQQPVSEQTPPAPEKMAAAAIPEKPAAPAPQKAPSLATPAPAAPTPVSAPSAAPQSAQPKKKKKRGWIVLSAILLLGVIGFFTIHDWMPATCKVPEKCSICGRTRGTPLDHEWQDATCEEPRRCRRCGLTEGEALGHDWAEATCEEPMTCTRCYATQGEPLGHIWSEATYDERATCQRCGETTGTVLGLISTSEDWAEDTVSLRDYNVHVKDVSPFVENCFRFWISVKVSDCSGSLPFNLCIYAENEKGKWVQVGKVPIEEYEAWYEYKIEPDEPVSFGRVTVVPENNMGDYSVAFGLFDVQCRVDEG